MSHFSLKKTEPDYLVLVNTSHRICPFYARSIDLVSLETAFGHPVLVEKLAGAQYHLLKDALLRAGIVISAESAYRSIKEQKLLMHKFQAVYGKAYAKQIVAPPRASEHHTGLAIDIVLQVNGKFLTENSDMLNEPVMFSVIHSMLPDYGFILRYPESKSQITGYPYEPWHIRYVGTAAAKEIYRRQITLEEYLFKND